MTEGTRVAPERPELPPLREVIAAHGITARRALGQHFLLDMNLTRRVARAAGDLRQVTVIEVGPGPGGLTRALLLEGARRVIAIERDERCVAALQSLMRAFPGRLEIVAADALEVDAAALAREAQGPAKIVANLPYNIAVPLLLRWLGDLPAFESLTLMFQKEVAARITAVPRTKAYGRLSVMVQWLCEARALFDVRPSAFTPPPKVTSTVVQLIPRPRPLAEADRGALERVVAAGFGQRRKMLRTSLKSLGLDAAALIDAVGLDPTARAEELTVQEFCALARALPGIARESAGGGAG
ncbi:MAG: 16S rRNA (adenine(1518)-N(6)/adenine(1519)-N(6))-dimethyltransferase RsmA [Alphaproteobacteria bacterium]